MRIISGIQPTGSLHIGNYLGAIKNWLELQEKNDCLFFIADWHSMTIPYKPEDLRNNVFEVAVTYLAVGLNPEKSAFFVQSHVKQHAELAWILNTVCPVGDLQRMTEYKDKAKRFKDTVNVGLLDYPVLMAADILLYHAQAVPVGKDQLQHLELARTIARKFNQRFGQLFLEPKALIPKVGEKIMALHNPKKKMSKSLGAESYISLFEEPGEIKRKIMGAVTDTGKEVKYNPAKKPGISNLLTIYSLFSEKSIKEAEKIFEGRGYAEFKKALADLLINSLESFRQKKRELLSREVYVHEVLRQGAAKAQMIAETTMREVREKTGLS